MKKMLKVFALLVGLVLIAGPSYALIGIDDAVPGHDIIVPFVVEIGATGLDTLIIIQEISDNAALGATEAKAAGLIHWYMYNSASLELKNRIIPYSGGDVVPVSVRDLINANCTDADRAAMSFDLNGDGTADSYVGYMYFDNLVNIVRNNLVAYFHYVELAAGRASGAYAAMKEWTGPGVGVNTTFNNILGYNYAQYAVANPTGAGSEPNFNIAANTSPTDFEAFSPAAYYWSAFRERAVPDAVIAGLGPVNLNFIRFVPRFYLHNANGETQIILWKNRNHNQVGVNNRIGIFMWNESEVRVSGWLNLPLELNIIRVRDILPPDFLAAYPSGGWIDILIAGDAGVINPALMPAGYLQNWRYTEFLMWTWMYAADTAASLNWASLWTDRQVGTQGTAPRPTD